MRIGVAVATLALSCLLAVLGPSGAAGQGEPPAELPQPNIVLIMTDDQPASTVLPEVMPNLHRLLIEPGTSFDDYIVTTPLCCPSRATTITGQYGHNNGVLRNAYGDLIGKKNVLPNWLRAAGYTTAHVGKFMNGYERFAERPKVVAPGWDLWFTQLEKRKYYNWKVSRNGKKLRLGEADRDHLTAVTNRRAATWTRKMVEAEDPFYLQLDYYAPHGALGRDNRCAGGPVPAPRDEGAFDGAATPQPPNFNEADVSDKPSFIASRPQFSEDDLEAINRRWRCTVESLLSVDRGIDAVYNEVALAGELDRTIFVFTSDNGYYFGEHRIPRGKSAPYEPNLRMPLTFLIPPAYRDFAPVQPVLSQPVANIDLAPSILDWAGASPCRGVNCRTMDGRSLRPLLSGTDDIPADRAFAVELFDCSYRAVRRADQIYFEYGRGPVPTTNRCAPTEIEHYNLADDPFQLENLYPAGRRTPAGREQLELEAEIGRLSECSGISGRDPAPAHGGFCD